MVSLTRVTHNGIATDKPVALRFQIVLEFGNVGFWEKNKRWEKRQEKMLGEKKKTREPGEKNLGAQTRTNNNLKQDDKMFGITILKCIKMQNA